jgi:hypothetical protein
MRQGSRREEVFFMLSELFRSILRLVGLDDEDGDAADDRRNADQRRNAGDRRRDDRDDDDNPFDFGD